MEQVLVGLPVSVALVYLDNILVPGCTFSQELANLGQVFERLRKAKVKLSPKKCVFFQRKVKYLGHIVSEEGISPDPGKQSWKLKASLDSALTIGDLSIHSLTSHTLYTRAPLPLLSCGHRKQMMLFISSSSL